MPFDWQKLRPNRELSEAHRELVREIADTFLSEGRGTPDHKKRVELVELGKDRTLLNELVQIGLIRNNRNHFYPTFQALYYLSDPLRDNYTEMLDFILRAIQGLYKSSGPQQFTMQAVEQAVTSLISTRGFKAQGAGSVYVHRATPFLLDFTRLVMVTESNNPDSPVSDVTALENILDYRDLQQAWSEELKVRSNPTHLQMAEADPPKAPTAPKPENEIQIPVDVADSLHESTSNSPQPTPTPSGEAATRWFDQPTIDRFSGRLWAVLNRGNEIRSSDYRPAVATLHLLHAFLEQPGGQLSELLGRIGVEPSAVIPSMGTASEKARPEDWTYITQPLFPPVSDDVIQALVNARNAADSTDSPSIDDSHLLFGVLSIGGNPLVASLNQRGLRANMVRVSAVNRPGLSTHVARDQWTTNDSLGHYAYAYAIYRFLTDPETKPPLAISIQAPWGAGKTSLMRMIQRQLDPEAPNKADQTARPSSNIGAEATVGHVRHALDSEVKKNSESAVPPIQDAGRVRRITIWFNAWKYESTPQVWAGLANCITEQIGERLGPVNRELFWLRLQVRRFDAGKIRRKIYQEVFASLYQKIVAWAPLYLAGSVSMLFAAIKAMWLGTSALFLGQAALFWAQLWKARSETDKKPAQVNLGEFVQAPDYAANLGFVHEVAEDLKHIFAIIPAKDLPMVIFIDDLDRCSPGKIAAVIEAVNLFLAGDFPHCMFILGIDDEMVAAALDEAHSDVISRLPAYARSSPIGWRFMDKFVQLPFVIPPPSPLDLERYVNSLLSQGGPPPQTDSAALDRAAGIVEQSDGASVADDRVVTQAIDKQELAPQQQEALKREVKIIQDMNQNINQFTDQQKRIRDLVSRRAIEHFNNPRDVKRFINLFRFYYFLRAARLARGEQVVSEDQLSRWLVLSLKWPEIVRWIRHNASPANAAAGQRLAKMEKLAGPVGTFTAWQNGMDEAFGLKPSDVSWLRDEELYGFFKREADSDEWKRLSCCDERGLW